MIQPDENDPQQVEADENLEVPTEMLQDLEVDKVTADDARGGRYGGMQGDGG